MPVDGVEIGAGEAPLCPVSGHPMELRTARRGRNAGGLFWGCTDYPHCRGTRDYEVANGGVAAGAASASPVEATQPDGPAPACPECAEPEMVLKVARSGRNAGRPFWSCPRYPDCRGTRDAVGGVEETTASPLAAPMRRRVLWTDATTSRPGWTCRYTTAGASLRSVAASRAVGEQTSQCWIARTEAIPSVSSDVERLAGLLRKILQRGAAPPIDPRSERRLLETLGMSGQVVAAPVPGDLSLRLQRRLDTKQLQEAVSWQNPQFAIESSLALGSDEEEQFIGQWLPERFGPAAARWVIPQAPLDALVTAAGIPAAGQRRLDFLALRPDGEALAIEIDGHQHADAALVDEDRDGLLESAGIPVARITVDELRAGAGIGLDEVSRFFSAADGAAAGDTYARLVWAPVQVHRLVLSLVEALQTGFLSGDRWVVEVDDPLDVPLELVEPYLDLFLAADRLWAGHVVADEVVIGAASRWRRYVATDNGFVQAELDQAPESIDLLVRLESDRSSTDRLEPRNGGPEIVVRSARLPVEVSDPVFEGSGRIVVRTEGEQVEWALRVMLQSIFAKEDFREGQLDALFEVFEGRDCAVLLPTGAGKSLIYQLAGLVLPGRTLVVDPLVALMEDQVEGLRAHGIDRVAAISSFTTAQGQGEALLEQVRSGYALFVFVAPERLQQRAFRDALRELSYTSLVNLAVVDEAHCVSEWGHDFRTSYLNLGRTLRTVCRDAKETPPPILALTGTASRAVLRDVLIELGIERDSERSVVRPRSFDRPELRFNIVRAEPANAQSALAGLLRGLPPRFGVPAGDFFGAREEGTYSGIVFCPHANGAYGVVDVRSKLASVTGVAPAIYAGRAPKGLENDWERIKRGYAAAFKTNEAPLLVSTKAFGMGIDKANIRYVVHYGIPGSIEGYYQEVGRAGRDRQRAECGLVLVEYDEDRARRLLADEIDLEDARREPKSARADSDDIDRQLYFHLRSFRGVDEELAGIGDVLDELDELGQRRSIELPMGTDEEARSQRERALHRLVVLGVVRDYLVEWGARTFPVELANVDSAGVVDHLVEYVRRNQPARAETVRERAAVAAAKPLGEAVLDCSRLLIEFVYDTVERSRRRSLREMWLAARESVGDPNGIFRQRILDYLSQGAIAPTLERLVDAAHFDYAEWIEELGHINAADDAREMRGDSARLLSSYPDHPGLLLARGLSEVLDDRGNLQEFASNLSASIENAASRYGVDSGALERFAQWLLAFCAGKRVGALALALVTLEQHSVAPAIVAGWQQRALREPGFDAGVRVLALASALDRLNPQLASIINHYEGARTS